MPRIYFGMVDVRDLADLQIRVMQDEAAKMQRFLATGGEVLSMLDVALMLRRIIGKTANRVPAKQYPDWVVRLSALFNAQAKVILPQLGVIRRSSSEKARSLLRWRPRSYDETVTDTARSLVRQGIVKSDPA